MNEQRRFEGVQQPVRWRTKGGLETPLIGRFYGEMKRLNFAPPRWYDVLVLMCVAFGLYCGLALIGFAWIGPLTLEEYGMPIAILAVGVTLAGVWAAFSNERLFCDLRQRTYTRLEGQGIGKRLTRGSMNELYGLVLMSENQSLMGTFGGQSVVYRLVLYWKGSKEPLLIIETHRVNLPTGVPINAGAGALGQRGLAYAKAMNLPFYDYSHVNSPGPLPIA